MLSIMSEISSEVNPGTTSSPCLVLMSSCKKLILHISSLGTSLYTSLSIKSEFKSEIELRSIDFSEIFASHRVCVFHTNGV